ncbi:MAG: deoxyribodipyrimidine photo-lyase [Planctomycetota bacterium]
MPSDENHDRLSLVWFKRDLRVSDHLPLHEAAQHGPAVGLYIYEPTVHRADEHDPSHLIFVNQCLEELRHELRTRGSELILAYGDAVEVLARLRRSLGFVRLYSHEETGLGATFERDKKVLAWCRSAGIAWREFQQHGVNRPTQSRDGWASRWRRHMNQPTIDTPTIIQGLSLDPETVGGLLSPGELRIGVSTKTHAQAGGSIAARKTLDTFLTERGEHYQQAMSSPVQGWDACSRISPYLAYGSISMREAYQTTCRRQDALPKGRTPWRGSLASFQKRLRWHCHFIQKLEDEPALESQNLCSAYDGMREQDRSRWGPSESERFDAWAAGRTGYPLVDACMRCLHTTGWINFRMRAMLVSFACYQLWLHWKPVAQHLARQFLDFEPGIHYPQCQMQAGVTGINTVRIYSPIKQAKDQDPGGIFIRQWVPELTDVPSEHIAQPEAMPAMTQQMCGCVIGVDYPEPIVDHKTAYQEAREKVYRVKGRAETRQLAQRVYQKHGSRRKPMQRRHQQRSRRST